MSKEQVKARTIEMLKLVGIANSEGVYKMYPHELSGGMRQRVCIAIGLACNPRLIIADEPTTALDVTIQAQILELLKKLHEERGMSIVLISHDMGVMANMCDRIAVMYGGIIVEEGTVDEIFYHAKHPYTKALLKSIPHPENSKAESFRELMEHHLRSITCQQDVHLQKGVLVQWINVTTRCRNICFILKLIDKMFLRH